MSWRPIWGVFKRHWYMTSHNPPEVFEMFYWAFLDLLIWGLLTTYLRQQEVKLPVSIGLLIGAVLLWTLLWRTQLGIGVAFLTEVWSENVISLLASPIRAGEYIAGAMLWTFAQLLIGWTAMVVLAWAVFSFGFLQFGPALIPFMGVLMLFGVAMALAVLGLVLRFGHGANMLAWGLGGLIMPLSAVYYPLTVLPGWVRNIAQGLPLARVFEAMRTVLAGRPAPWSELGIALILDVAYIAAAGWFAYRMFLTLRRRGYITRYV
jgi:ABC-2 type transport system permease protein